MIVLGLLIWSLLGFSLPLYIAVLENLTYPVGRLHRLKDVQLKLRRIRRFRKSRHLIIVLLIRLDLFLRFYMMPINSLSNIAIVIRHPNDSFLIVILESFSLSMFANSLVFFECAVDAGPWTVWVGAFRHVFVDEVTSDQVFLGFTMSQALLAQGA